MAYTSEDSAEILSLFDAACLGTRDSSIVVDETKFKSRWTAVLEMDALEGIHERSLPDVMFGVKMTDLNNDVSPKQATETQRNITRTLFIMLTAIQQLHGIDYSPFVVHAVYLMLQRSVADHVCFAIIEFLLHVKNRDKYVAPLITSPVHVIALHHQFELVLHRVIPLTTAVLVELANSQVTYPSSSGAPVLSGVSASVFMGIMTGILPDSIRVYVLRDFLRYGWMALVKLGVGLLKLVKAQIKDKNVSTKLRSISSASTGTSPALLALSIVQELHQGDGGSIKEIRIAANKTRNSSFKPSAVPSPRLLGHAVSMSRNEFIAGLRDDQGAILQYRVDIWSSLQLCIASVAVSQHDSGYDTSPPPPLALHDSMKRLRLEIENHEVLIKKNDKESIEALAKSKVLPALLLSHVGVRWFLAECLPPVHRHRRLRLCFSTDVEGYHLPTLVESVKHPNWFLVIQTPDNKLFGACGIDAPIGHKDIELSSSPYSFLFTMQSSSSGSMFRNDKGKDGQICPRSQFFGIGPAGDGDGYGLELSEDLQHGSSVVCPGFGNAPLHLTGNSLENNAATRNFGVSVVEVYELVL